MSEQTMTEENKKTIVAFIAGLLIGGLLVFIFIEPAKEEAKSVDSETTSISEEVDTNNDASADDIDLEISSTDSATATETDNRPVAGTVSLDGIEFPEGAGWVGVRDFEGGQLTGLLGVARITKEEGLIPTEVPLLRSTVKGRTYAIVFYSDNNNDKRFDLATDAQLDVEVEEFTAE